MPVTDLRTNGVVAMDGFFDFLADVFIPTVGLLGVVLVARIAVYAWRDPDFKLED